MYIEEFTFRVANADLFFRYIWFNDYLFYSSRKALAAPNNHQEDSVKKKLKSDYWTHLLVMKTLTQKI